MLDRRKEPRVLCAEILDVCWRDNGGRANKSAANLEDISLAGVYLLVDSPIPETTVRITHAHGNRACSGMVSLEMLNCRMGTLEAL
jgi:hypothetical protein